MNTHTPGPWKLHLEDPEFSESLIWGPKGPGHGAIADTAPHGPAYYQEGREEALANARLIAAAPDLLEAAKALLWPLDIPKIYGATPHLISKHREQLRQAITKATQP